MNNITAEKTNSFYSDNLTVNLSLQKITSVWAFSESAFGGLLHALKIPFRGIFISSAAVIFITLIAFVSKQSKEILRSSLIVLAIKALVSPQSPLTAYFAVSLQAIAGYVLFALKKLFKISAMLLGIFSLLFSGVQKVVVLTILFGNTLWKSVNIFVGQVAGLFFGIEVSDNINYGYLLAGIYLLIHLIAGILIGLYAGKLPEKINLHFKKHKGINLDSLESGFPQNNQKKKRYWYQRPTGIIIFLLSGSLLIFTYFSPSGIEIKGTEIIFMLLRSVILTLVWFIIISPVLRRLFQKFLVTKKSGYTQQMDQIINLFPQFRKIVSYCWSSSSENSGLKRIYNFLSSSFYCLLSSESI